MKNVVGLLLFLVFVNDYGLPYARLAAPFQWVQSILLSATPVAVRPFDFLMMGIWAFNAGKGNRRGAYVGPMKNALLLVVATTLLWFLIGLFHGGQFRFASWQTYLILSMVLTTFTIAATFRAAEDYFILARWLIAAAVYRAIMCWISYFTWAHAMVGESGAFLTSHDDTISWITSILVLIIQAVDRRSTKIVARNMVAILFLLGAVHLNSRRIAWVSLAMGAVVMYIFFPDGVAKRRITRVLKFAAPVILLYVVVGWGRSSKIFLPLRSLSTVSTQEDGSTLARNAENLGLIATSKYSSFLFGTGWGLPYVYLTLKYDISSFELWRYVPHNSILGLLAFTGVLGFAGFWMALPTAVFLCARIARLAADSKSRSVAIIGASQLIVCCNQLYGDMGIFFLKPMYVIAVSYAIALRLPVTLGLWDGSRRKVAIQK